MGFCVFLDLYSGWGMSLVLRDPRCQRKSISSRVWGSMIPEEVGESPQGIYIYKYIYILYIQQNDSMTFPTLSFLSEKCKNTQRLFYFGLWNKPSTHKQCYSPPASIVISCLTLAECLSLACRGKTALQLPSGDGYSEFNHSWKPCKSQKRCCAEM